MTDADLTRGYALAGVPLYVRVPDDPALSDCLAELLFDIAIPGGGAESVTVELVDGVYHISGEGLNAPFTCHDPVDTACGVTAGLIGAYAIRVSDRLCFHAAALIHNGKAYLIPATYKSGKSTFCAAWMAQGHQIITDDAAVFDARTHFVSSFGIPLRLRNSLLRDGPEELRSFAAQNMMIRGPRLSYVRAPDSRSCIPGTSYPLGGWIFLDRRLAARPSVSRMTPTDSLGQIIWQNFARQMPASDLLGVLRTIATQYPCYLLRYSEAAEAVPALAAALDEPEGHLPHSAESEDFGNIFAIGGDGHIQVTETSTGLYLADDRYGRIYFLNPTAGVMYKLAAEGLEMPDVLEILCELYPEQNAESLSADYRRFLSETGSLGLLASVASAA
jgi:hypothetical protein